MTRYSGRTLALTLAGGMIAGAAIAMALANAIDGDTVVTRDVAVEVEVPTPVYVDRVVNRTVPVYIDRPVEVPVIETVTEYVEVPVIVEVFTPDPGAYDAGYSDGYYVAMAAWQSALATPCPVEDADGCYWDAARMGNGIGDSFVTVNGTPYYYSD